MASSKRKATIWSVTTLAMSVGVLIIIGVIVAQTWWAIRQDKILTLDTATKNSVITVRFIEENANRIFHDAYQSIYSTLDELKSKDNSILQDEANARQVLSNQRRDSQVLFSLSLIDNKGMLWASSLRYPIERINISKQNQIAYLTSKNKEVNRNIVFGNSYINPKLNQSLLPLAINIHDNDEKLIGQLQAEIRLGYFDDYYESVAKDVGADIFLLDKNGNLIAHSLNSSRNQTSKIDDEVVQRIKSSFLKKGKVENSFINEKQDKFYSFLKMNEFPLVVVFGSDLDTILFDWNKRKEQKIYFALIFIIFSLILAILLFKKIQSLRLSKEKLEESERRYRMLFEDAQDGILLINKNLYFVDANQNALEMLAVDVKTDLVNLDVGEFSADFRYTQPTVAAKKAEAIKKYMIAAFKGKVQKFEWISHRRGRDWYSEVTLSRVVINAETMIFCVVRDISQRKHAERLLQGQNQLLQLIGSNESLESIMIDTCHFVEKNNPHWHCGVQLLSADQKIFTQVIGHNFPEILRRQMIDAPVCIGNGIWSEAVMDMVPVWINDISRSPSMKLITQRKLLSNYAAVGSWPIMGKTDMLLGAFTLFSESGTPLNNKELSLISIATDIASIAIEGKRAEEKAIRLAHYDEITHLPNRFLFIQYLSKAILYAKKNKSRLAVLFLDLDRFKSINDIFDHKVGDKVLGIISQKMKNILTHSDTIARAGGDEFIVLLEDFHTTRDVTEVADRLLEVISQSFKINEQEMKLSASIGIALYPNDGIDSQELMKNAEMAMYRAKQNGRANYQFYAAEMNVNTIRRLEYETQIRHALDKQQFVVYYQPKVNVLSGKIVGAEALVRWNHPDLGLVFPGDFIGIAEEAGLIGRIGMQVIERTCKDIADFHLSDMEFGRVAINLSGTQFVEENIVTELLRVLDFWEVSSSLIEFEITESMVMQDIDLAIKHMDELIKAGFTLSIDDFGTGYSSLSYLKRFPVNSVKIDRSFIQDMHGNKNDAAIVLAIVAMAKTLGLKVVAEGIENQLQLETLQNCNCDEYQGFYFSRAVPANEFIELLKKNNS